MKCPTLIIALTLLAFTAGCATRKTTRSATSPQYAAVVTQTDGIRQTVNSARSDSKEVKRLQSASLGLLDEIDAKLVKLLQK